MNAENTENPTQIYNDSNDDEDSISFLDFEFFKSPNYIVPAEEIIEFVTEFDEPLSFESDLSELGIELYIEVDISEQVVIQEDEIVLFTEADFLEIDEPNIVSSPTSPSIFESKRVSLQEQRQIWKEEENQEVGTLIDQIKLVIGTDSKFNEKVGRIESSMLAHMAACTIHGEGGYSSTSAMQIVNNANHTLTETAAQSVLETTTYTSVISRGSSGVGGQSVSIFSSGDNHTHNHEKSHIHTDTCAKCGSYVPASGSCYKCSSRR